MNSELTITLKLTVDDLNITDLAIFDSLSAGDAEAFLMDLHELYCIDGIGFLEVVGMPVVDVSL